MSETFYIVKKVVEKKHNDSHKLSLNQKLLIASLIFGVAILPPSTVQFFHRPIGKIGIIISAIVLINFSFRVYKMINQAPERDPNELINELNDEMVDKEITNLRMIESLIDEVEKEIEREDKKKDLLFKRISTVFMFIFWIPFCFLTKYTIESSGDILGWNDYLTISTGLITIAAYLIALIFIVGSQFDEILSFEKNKLKLVRNYLYDIRYQYLK